MSSEQHPRVPAEIESGIQNFDHGKLKHAETAEKNPLPSKESESPDVLATHTHTHTERDSEWQWHQLGHMQVCTSLQADNHASTPPLSFLQAGCPSCRPTNSVKALKACSSK